MQVKKQRLEPDMDQRTSSRLGKKYVKAAYCHTAYLTYMQSTSWEMPGWMKNKLDSRLPGEISITSYIQVTPSYSRKQRGTKELLDESKRGEWKIGLKLNIQKPKIMASSPITSWQIDGETMETATDFIFLHPQITADGYCSHEIKRCLVLGRKAMMNLDSILNSKDYFTVKVCLVKAMDFPVVMCGCESWTIKRAEYRRIDAFEL